MRKNCKNCKWLEYVSAESWESAGFCCNKRDYRSSTEEDNHLGQMESDEYLGQPKKCCELKEQK